MGFSLKDGILKKHIEQENFIKELKKKLGLTEENDYNDIIKKIDENNIKLNDLLIVEASYNRLLNIV